MNNEQRLAELQQGIKDHLHEATSMAFEYDQLGGSITLNTMLHFEKDEETTNHLIGYEADILNVLLSNKELTGIILRSLKTMLDEEEKEQWKNSLKNHSKHIHTF